MATHGYTITLPDGMVSASGMPSKEEALWRTAWLAWRSVNKRKRIFRRLLTPDERRQLISIAATKLQLSN